MDDTPDTTPKQVPGESPLPLTSVASTPSAPEVAAPSPSKEVPPAPPRRRGRKPKSLLAQEAAAAAPAPEAPAAPRRRGRKPKSASTAVTTESEAPAETHVRRTSTVSYPEPETVGGHEPQGNHRRRHRGRRRSSPEMTAPSASSVRVDREELRRRAWKIFLGEVTEEGLALMDDAIAAETARRAFRVAEIFLIEAEKHSG